MRNIESEQNLNVCLCISLVMSECFCEYIAGMIMYHCIMNTIYPSKNIKTSNFKH